MPALLTDGNKKYQWYVQKVEADDEEEDGEKHAWDNDKETTPLQGFIKKKGSSTLDHFFTRLSFSASGLRA